MEEGESFVASVKREMREETGLLVDHLRLVGIKQFPVETGRYIVLLYRTNSFSGTLKDSEEGHVGWFTREEIKNLNTVPDFEEHLKVYETEDLSELQYYYDDQGERLLNIS